MNERGFNKFYWGFLFIMVSFRLQGIDILPNVIGYILLGSGFSILSSRSEYFQKAAKLNIPMIILSIFSIYEPPAQGSGINFGPLGPLGLVLGIASIILGLMVVYNLLMGVKDMAEEEGQGELSLEAEQRWRQYMFLQVGVIFAFLLIFIPILAVIYIIGLLLASIILTVAMMGFMKRCGSNLQDKNELE